MKPKAPKPGEFADYTIEEQAGIKRLLADDTYRHAIDWILYKVCGLSDICHYQSSADTSFALGRRSVAQHIVSVAALPMKQQRPPKSK